jgi:hypothetical protein
MDVECRLLHVSREPSKRDEKRVVLVPLFALVARGVVAPDPDRHGQNLPALRFGAPWVLRGSFPRLYLVDWVQKDT